MQAITFNKEEGIKLWKSCDKAGKKLLEEKYGTMYFKQHDAMEEFKQFCEETGLNPDDYIAFKNPVNDDQRSVNAYSFLVQIVRHHRDSVKVDWNRSNQKKYWAWYNMNATSGFGLSFSDCVYADSVTRVASRLVSLEEKLPRELFEKYPAIHSDYMVEKNN